MRIADMEQCKGLIAGIDIGYSKIQASVYSYNSRNGKTDRGFKGKDQSCKCCR